MGPGMEIPARLADRVLVLASPGRRGLWCTTKGLSGFGLPELQTFNVPLQIGVAWAGALTAVALRMIELWLEAIREESGALVELPAVIEFTAGDVARAYGAGHEGGGPSARVQLRPDPAQSPMADSFFTVGPPDGISGSAANYLTRICGELFGTVPP